MESWKNINPNHKIQNYGEKQNNTNSNLRMIKQKFLRSTTKKFKSFDDDNVVCVVSCRTHRDAVGKWLDTLTLSLCFFPIFNLIILILWYVWRSVSVFVIDDVRKWRDDKIQIVVDAVVVKRVLLYSSMLSRKRMPCKEWGH